LRLEDYVSRNFNKKILNSNKSTMAKLNYLLPAVLFVLFSCKAQTGTGINKGELKTKPNIIFFFTDDQAYDTQKDYGNPDVKTPNIDKLADEGMVFMRHYNTTAICMASRANVMIGQYEYKTGTNFMHGPMKPEKWSDAFPMKLKKAGYSVGFGGKFGFSISDNLKDKKKEGEVAKHDFDFWAGGKGQTSYQTANNPSIAKYAEAYPHSSRAYAAATIDFMRASVEKEQPFCMSVFFKAPHRPATPDPMFDDIYKDTKFRKLPNYGREAGKHLAPHSTKGRQYPRFEEWGYDKEETYQEALRKYNQLIYGIDYSIGMIREELKRLGIDDNTVIIFSSDNGYFNGSHGLGSKVLPYEESVRCPLIISDPRHKKSGAMRKTNMLSANVDISATILDIAGVEIPAAYDGISLLPVLDSPKKPVRTSLPIIQVWGTALTHCFSVINQDYKYIYWFYKDESKGLEPTEELFDLKKDPYEMVNLASAAKNKSELNKMRELYDQQLQHWKTEGVKYNGYKQYGVLFDRSISWKEKEKLMNEVNNK
tara:strand:- start:1459 stop:3072 length:1614 start_codon:yes stop_codon:yes gene_type:complete